MPPRKKADEQPAEEPQEQHEQPQRPQHERSRIVEGQVADVQRLRPAPIKEEERKKLNLWQKRALMIDELGTVPKRGWNKHHQYSFAMEADVVAYLGPLMTKYMVVVNVSVLLDQVERIEMGRTSGGSTMVLTRLPVEITIINADNPEERETVEWIGEGSDTGDKGVYKSYTGALKYFYLKWFQIATGDDPEVFERTDQLNESGGRRGVEALSDEGTTQVSRSRRRQPERGGRQQETTDAQIRHLGNLSIGLSYGPRGTAEVIDETLGTNLTDTLAEIENEEAQRHALVDFLRARPGTDTGKVIYAMTQIAEQAAQTKQPVASQVPVLEAVSEEEMLEQARAEIAAENEKIANMAEEEEAQDASGATREEDGSGS